MSEVDLIGKRATVRYEPIRDGGEVVVEGEITGVQLVRWSSTLGVPRFDPYEQITISLATPGETGTHTISSATKNVTILE